MQQLSFIVAGVQKAGTTALWHFLRQHPEIYLPEKKELHFFDDELVDWASPPYDNDYHSYFEYAQPRQQLGEVTPIYTFWPQSLARIASYNPGIKLIVILRDPVARAFSHWRMEFARGFDTFEFSAAIRGGRGRLANGTGTADRIFSYVERGLYLDQIRRLHSLFPRKNILYLTHMRLKNDLLQTLLKVTDFLEVAPFASYPPNQIVFSHQTLEFPPMSAEDAAYLHGLFREDWQLSQSLAGIEIECET